MIIARQTTKVKPVEQRLKKEACINRIPIDNRLRIWYIYNIVARVGA